MKIIILIFFLGETEFEFYERTMEININNRIIFEGKRQQSTGPGEVSLIVIACPTRSVGVKIEKSWLFGDPIGVAWVQFGRWVV